MRLAQLYLATRNIKLIAPRNTLDYKPADHGSRVLAEWRKQRVQEGVWKGVAA